MPIIIFYSTLSFWFLTILQASVVPFWLMDLNYLAIVVWGIYYAKNRQKFNYPLWGFGVPVIFGLGLASFLFYSYWTILPYFIGSLIMGFLLARKSQWLLRLKEGLISLMVIFLLYLMIVVLIRNQALNYVVTFEFFTKTLITFFAALLFWGYSLRQAGRHRIR